MQRIKELEQQNRMLRQEVEQWKLKYYNIQKAYTLILTSKQGGGASLPDLVANELAEQIGEKMSNDKQNEGVKTDESEDRIEIDYKASPTHSNDEKDISSSLEEPHFFQNHKKQEENLKLSLITGCFLLEKRRSSNFNPIKYTFPCEMGHDDGSTYDAIYRFIFIQETIEEIVDDEQESRKNEIFYGSTYEDFHFVFDDYKSLPSKQLSNQFLKQSNLMRKQHVFGIVRPQILVINEKIYETQIAFGFISEVPIFTYFRDLNRMIQQQIKLSLLNGSGNQLFEDRLDVIANIVKNICKFSIDHHLSINTYPINLCIDAPLCTIDLKYTSSENFLLDQMNYAQSIIHLYSKKKIIKIIHYLLSERGMIIICKTRKTLNQLFQILKIILQPLNWIFPIVYSYTPFYEPFLSSPLPILIGYVKREYYQDWEEVGDSQGDFLPPNDLIHIKAETDEDDLKQLTNFEKRIKKCEKWAAKDLKEDSILKEKLVSANFAKKIAENKLCFKLHYYVRQLLKQSCGNQSEADDFLLNFKESQMLSYYAQNINQQ